MLDHTMRRAAEAGLDNVTPARADAREMPYEDDAFDGAFLVTVLGEIPDQDAALSELRRVVKPGGRIVVGELFGDPHMVTHKALRRRAEAAGLQVEGGLGGALWHYTRLQPLVQP
jgi:ubiquinone/menaquinone biosynthesis C-methylase UbiE